MNKGRDILHQTQSLCPVCLTLIEARHVVENDSIFLEKTCPVHGLFKTRFWEGRQNYENWTRPKLPIKQRFNMTPVDKGCPFDCGLCPAHGQHTCTALIEITQRCNLGCPVCFADAGGGADREPSLARIGFLLDRVLAASGSCNLQLSGGEPTVREDLPAIIALARRKGFSFVQLNTNGLRLAAAPDYAVQLKEAGLASVFLQFDGLSAASHQALRGRDLRAVKEAAIRHAAAAGLGIVLVPTLVPGVNTAEVGAIIDYAARFAPAVRGVHFQPVSYFGRFPQAPADTHRLTLPEVISLIAAQCGGAIRPEHFAPPACEHALCSFHGTFVIDEDNRLLPLGNRQSACCATGPTPTALEGREKSVSFTARQWSLPLAAAACGCTPGAGAPMDDLDRFLARARTHTFSISAMAFQDAWNLDLERLRGCCIHVVAPDGRLVPFCAYNLTSSEGRALYRVVIRP